LWAREFGCESYPLDFGFTSPFKQIPPGNWFELIRDDWPQLIDSDRLELRIDENKALIAHLEQLLGESFSFRRLSESMDLVNEQMDFYWAARDLMAQAERTPVTLRDQLAMYQMIWHRGTKTAVEFGRRYYEEVAERVDGGLAAYENETIRLLYWDTAAEPAFHPFLQETYGAVFVACPFTVSAACYARTVYDDDPLRAMSARHLFLLERTPEWGVREAIDQHCDAVIGIESPNDYRSALAKAIEDRNIPYLGVPDIRDSPERREMVARFLEDRLGAKRR
jgi:benzoyl-CoA reductase/2-hydroxyglutaryl-CoA dehydratase subunit BcrC/BadD/HgdB